MPGTNLGATNSWSISAGTGWKDIDILGYIGIDVCFVWNVFGFQFLIFQWCSTRLFGSGAGRYDEAKDRPGPGVAFWNPLLGVKPTFYLVFFAKNFGFEITKVIWKHHKKKQHGLNTNDFRHVVIHQSDSWCFIIQKSVHPAMFWLKFDVLGWNLMFHPEKSSFLRAEYSCNKNHTVKSRSDLKWAYVNVMLPVSSWVTFCWHRTLTGLPMYLGLSKPPASMGQTSADVWWCSTKMSKALNMSGSLIT